MKIVLSTTKNRITAGQWQACAHIKLAQYKADSEGNIFLSADCKTSLEVHEWADKLIEQLQDVKRLANGVEWNNRPRG